MLLQLDRLPQRGARYAQRVHRANFDPNEVQVSTLLSIKTGACPEDCAYCSQSIRFETGLKSEPLLELEEVVAKARIARANGATRFCMGAAYRSPKPKQLAQIAQMIQAVRELGMETCATLGMLTPEQARELKDAGLDYYNHNLDTGRSHYGAIVTTRGYDERLATLAHVRAAGMAVCCGGILGMGEPRRALEYFAQVTSLTRELGYTSREAIALVNMGAVYDSLGEYQKALEHYGQALPLLRVVGDRREEGVVLNSFIQRFLKLVIKRAFRVDCKTLI